MLFDNDELFVGNAVDDSQARRAAASLRTRSRWSPSRVLLAGGSLGGWRMSVSRHNMNLTRELSELVVEDNHSSLTRSLWRRTPGRLVSRVEGVASRRGPKDIPPHLFSLVCVLPLLLWPQIPLMANLLIFFLPKSSFSRSSVLSACSSIFTKQNVAVVTHNGRAHYNVCTYFGMPIKLFLIRIWPRPPPPFS